MELSVEALARMRRSGSTCSTSPQPVGQSSTFVGPDPIARSLAPELPASEIYN
jgi:hypothetical protein